MTNIQTDLVNDIISMEWLLEDREEKLEFEKMDVMGVVGMTKELDKIGESTDHGEEEELKLDGAGGNQIGDERREGAEADANPDSKPNEEQDQQKEDRDPTEEQGQLKEDTDPDSKPNEEQEQLKLQNENNTNARPIGTEDQQQQKKLQKEEDEEEFENLLPNIAEYKDQLKLENEINTKPRSPKRPTDVVNDSACWDWLVEEQEEEHWLETSSHSTNSTAKWPILPDDKFIIKWLDRTVNNYENEQYKKIIENGNFVVSDGKDEIANSKNQSQQSNLWGDQIGEKEQLMKEKEDGKFTITREEEVYEKQIQDKESHPHQDFTEQENHISTEKQQMDQNNETNSLEGRIINLENKVTLYKEALLLVLNIIDKGNSKSKYPINYQLDKNITQRRNKRPEDGWGDPQPDQCLICFLAKKNNYCEEDSGNHHNLYFKHKICHGRVQLDCCPLIRTKPIHVKERLLKMWNFCVICLKEIKNEETHSANCAAVRPKHLNCRARNCNKFINFCTEHYTIHNKSKLDKRQRIINNELFEEYIKSEEENFNHTKTAKEDNKNQTAEGRPKIKTREKEAQHMNNKRGPNDLLGKNKSIRNNKFLGETG